MTLFSLSLSSSYHFLMRTARLCEVCFHALMISRGILQRRRLEYYREGGWNITEEFGILQRRRLGGMGKEREREISVYKNARKKIDLIEF